jgi:hypothetical protein
MTYNVIHTLQASKPAGQAGSAKSSGKKTFDGTYTRGKTVRLYNLILFNIV